MTSTIMGWGHYLPSKMISNAELPSALETNDQWIIERTGIKQRFIAKNGETTRTMATQAALNALANAGCTIKDIDAIILATTTPDKTFPATSVEVQRDLGMNHGFAFDLQAVCSGFIYALSVAKALITTNQAKTILVIGAETMSRLLDWTDRRTCILFGDGAGALIVSSGNIISTKLYSDGSFNELLQTDGGPSINQKVGTLEMNGREVFRHAVQKMSTSVKEILEECHLNINQIDWIVPHQANKRILEAIAEKLDIPIEKMICTVDEHANTSAASIPLALSTTAKKGLIQKGHKVLCTALGGGFTWGASLLQW